MSADNNTRREAEVAFTRIKTEQLPQLLSALMVILSTHEDAVLRRLSAILLRRSLLKGEKSPWASLAPELQATVKSTLLARVVGEQDAKIRKIVADLTGTLALGLLDDGNFPELLPFLFEQVSSGEAVRREAALRVFARLAPFVAVNMQDHLPAMRDIFAACLTDAAAATAVRIAAMQALGNLILSIDLPSERNVFQALIPSVLQALGEILSADFVEEAVEAIEMLIEVADESCTFFRPHGVALVQAMTTIAGTTDLEDRVRQMALELLVAMAEGAGPMCRKMPDDLFVRSVVPLLCNMLLELEDADDELQEWEASNDEDGDICNYDIALQDLDRVAEAIGPKRVLPVVSAVLAEFLGNQDWKYRHAALMALSQMVCILPQQPGDAPFAEIVGQLLPFTKDAHRRVRYAAINVFGQLALDHGPSFQAGHHGEVLPTLMQAAQDPESPKVQSHAAAAINNFVDNFDSDLLEPYLETLLGLLFVHLRDGSRVVQEQAVTAIASVAECADDKFEPYYATFMPLLTYIVVNCTTKPDRLFRAKTLECISFVGLAVSKELFGPDAVAVMDAMLKDQAAANDPDDPGRSYRLQVWARMCKILGSDFEPYLPLVMEPLLTAAQLEAEIFVSGGGDDDGDDAAVGGGAGGAKDEDEDDTVTFNDHGGRQVRVRTSYLEEKATACRMIACLVSDLKDSFYPFAEQSATVLLPLMLFDNTIHEDIRIPALMAMPDIVACVRQVGAKAGGPDQGAIMQLVTTVAGQFLVALKTEPELEVLLAGLQAFSKLIEAACMVPGAGRFERIFNAQEMGGIIELLIVVMKESFQRRAVRIAEKKTDEDYDEEAEEEMWKAEHLEEQVQFQVSECIGVFIRTHQDDFMPVFRSLVLDLVLQMGHPSCCSNDKKTAIFIIDDMVEFGGPAGHEFLGPFLEVLLRYSSDDDVALRQAAVYGLGVLAVTATDKVGDSVGNIVVHLQGTLSRADAQTEDAAQATDNAVSALGKIILKHASWPAGQVDLAALIPAWQGMLPLRADKTESKVATGQLCSLLEGGAVHDHLLGPGGERIGRIFEIFANAAGAELLDEALTARASKLIREMQGALPGEVLQAAFNALSAEQQASLQRLG